MTKSDAQVIHAMCASMWVQRPTIVRALGARLCGLTRQDISAATGIALGGTLTSTLDELEARGFLRRYHAYRKKEREALYQLIDPFSLFLPSIC